MENKRFFAQWYSQDGTLRYEGYAILARDGHRYGDGKGKEYYENGILQYEGTFKYFDKELESYHHGNGTLFREDGSLWYKGEFYKDEFHGYGKLYDNDNILIYEGEFNKGKRLTTSKVSDERLESLVEELNDLIGLDGVKKEVYSMINFIRIQNKRLEMNLPTLPISYHLVFTGNPGTGKTTIARLISKIYATLGVVSKGHMIETDRSGMVAGYVGQTALKVDELVEKARGGVLFIDEAYSLVREDTSNDFGYEAVDCLIKRMEDYRTELVVIVAGYDEPMKKFLNSNPGLKSRFNKFIHFDDYSDVELIEIFQYLCERNKYTFNEEFKEKLQKKIFQSCCSNRIVNFSNGRFIRNIFEKLVIVQCNRIINNEELNLKTLTQFTINDLNRIISDNVFENTY